MKIIMVVNKDGIPLLRTVAMSTHDSWSHFFREGGGSASGVCMGDAIKAYKTIGYKTIEFELANPVEVDNRWCKIQKLTFDQYVATGEMTENERQKRATQNTCFRGYWKLEYVTQLDDEEPEDDCV